MDLRSARVKLAPFSRRVSVLYQDVINPYMFHHVRQLYCIVILINIRLLHRKRSEPRELSTFRPLHKDKQ
jgi:hypothetical protein